MENDKYLMLAINGLPPETQKIIRLADGIIGITKRLPSMTAREISAVTGMPPKMAARTAEAMRGYEEKGRREEERLEEIGFRMVAVGSVEYPALLRHIPDPPPLLFARGSLPSPETPCIAVVGARKADAYGREAAFRIGKGLGESSCCVVSGMARGIDGASHWGCLAGGGSTVAVLGSGPDVVYPPEHRDLFERICKSGCVITEHPPGTPPLKQNFPRRNRIIAGMSLATTVVQADLRSGSLSTANHALEFGREVMAVPGSIFSQLSRGVHSLLMDGAHPVETGLDILRHLGIVEEPPRERVRPRAADLDGDVRRIYEMCDGLNRISSMADETSMPADEITAALSLLEAKGLVIRRPGGIFIKT